MKRRSKKITSLIPLTLMAFTFVGLPLYTQAEEVSGTSFLSSTDDNNAGCFDVAGDTGLVTDNPATSLLTTKTTSVAVEAIISYRKNRGELAGPREMRPAYSLWHQW